MHQSDLLSKCGFLEAGTHTPSPLPTMMPSDGFVPTEEELRLVNGIWDTISPGQNMADLRSLTTLFTVRGVSPSVLNGVWALIDPSGFGSVSRTGLAAAIRLMGWAQSGAQLKEELTVKSGPLPKLTDTKEFIPRRPLPIPGPSLLDFPESSTAPKERKAESLINFSYNEAFKEFFIEGIPQNGLLNRESALHIFTSKVDIPLKYVTQVFELIDISSRRALDIHEFCLGMHILQAFDSNMPLVLPPTLPIAIESQLVHLQSELVKAGASPPTKECPEISHSSPPITLVDPDGTKWTTTKYSDSTPLSTDMQNLLNTLRSNLTQTGSVSGTVLATLNSRYSISPAKIAQIWAATSRHNTQAVSLDVIETMIQKVHDLLTACSDNVSFVGPPSGVKLSISNSLNADPSRFSFTDDDEGAHTDSSDASSVKWSIRPQGSFSESGTSCYQHLSEYSKKHDQPRIDLRTSSDVPVGSQYFMEEIQSLKSQLQEAKQQRRLGNMSMKSQIQRHFVVEIDRLTSELAQKAVEHEDSQMHLTELRKDADNLVAERERLRKLVDAQNKEMADMKTHDLGQKFAIRETLSSTVEKPIHSLHSTVVQSQTEINQVKRDISRLLDLVASQKDELSRLQAATSSREHSEDRWLTTRGQTLHKLETQVLGMRNMMEQLFTELKTRGNLTSSTGEVSRANMRTRRQTPPPVLPWQLEFDPLLVWDDVSTLEDKTITASGDNKSVPGNSQEALHEPAGSSKPVKGILHIRTRSLPMPINAVQSSSAPPKQVAFDLPINPTFKRSRSESLASTSRPPVYLSGGSSPGSPSSSSSAHIFEKRVYEPVRRDKMHLDSSPAAMSSKGKQFQEWYKTKIGWRLGRDTKHEAAHDQNFADGLQHNYGPEDYTINPIAPRHRLQARSNNPDEDSSDRRDNLTWQEWLIKDALRSNSNPPTYAQALVSIYESRHHVEEEEQSFKG